MYAEAILMCNCYIHFVKTMIQGYIENINIRIDFSRNLFKPGGLKFVNSEWKAEGTKLVIFLLMLNIINNSIKYIDFT